MMEGKAEEAQVVSTVPGQKVVVLPFSKHKVFLRDRITYADEKAISEALQSGTKSEMTDGEIKQTFDATSYQKYERKLIETFVIKAEDANGVEIQINTALNTDLDIEDGLALEEAVKEIYNDLKKRLKKTV